MKTRHTLILLLSLIVANTALAQMKIPNTNITFQLPEKGGNIWRPAKLMTIPLFIFTPIVTIT